MQKREQKSVQIKDEIYTKLRTGLPTIMKLTTEVVVKYNNFKFRKKNCTKPIILSYKGDNEKTNFILHGLNCKKLGKVSVDFIVHNKLASLENGEKAET